MDSFKIKTEVFEGPLELLLTLIEKRKLYINDISLGKVTDDYLAYIRNLSQFPLGDAAHFILIASTLLLIKSKSLLPMLSLTEEEQGNIEELEDRLKNYSRIKELSLHIRERFGKMILFRKNPSEPAPIFSPSKDISVAALVDCAHRVLQSIPKLAEKLPEVEVKKIRSLEETIVGLTDRIKQALKMSFRDFAGTSASRKGELPREEKVNVIVSFLAMLELVKQGIIEAEQNGMFADIHMESREVATPRYS